MASSATPLPGSSALVRTLRGLTPDFGSFNDSEFDEGRFEEALESNPRLAVAASRYWIRKLQACVYAGDHASPSAAASKAAALIWTVPTQIELTEYHLYGGLARAGRCDTALGGGARPGIGGARSPSQADRGLGGKRAGKIRP